MSLGFVTNCANQRKGPEISGLSRVHFDYDRATIRPDMVRLLDGNASYLQKNSSTNIVIEGHCDERGTNEYNLALGDRRANTAKSYLVRKGVNQNRIRTVSYGEEKPLSQGHDESAWYLNRRAEFNKN